MEDDSWYIALDPAAEDGIFEIGDSDSSDLIVEVVGGNSVYLKVTDLSDTDAECVLGGSNIGNVHIIGYVGPYENSDRENVCGCLFNVNSNVLLDSTYGDLYIDMGNGDETATFTLTYPLPNWEDKSEMEEDYIYYSLSP